MDVKVERERLGLSGKEAARLAGISPQSYSYIERGQRKPSVEVAKRLARVLNVPWISFFEDDAPRAGTEGILAPGIEKLTIFDTETQKEIAVITNELITTAADNIVVKIKPALD